MSVNQRVTTKRVRETTEYAAFIRRALRAHGRRVAEADDADLAELVALRDELEAAITVAVQGQKDGLGRSWAEVARGLGVSRQYAQRHYGQAETG